VNRGDLTLLMLLIPEPSAKNITDLMLSGPKSVKTVSRGSFESVSAWCWNLAPKGANLTGLMPVKFLNHSVMAQHCKDFSREF